MLNGLQPWHILILVVVLIALFGARRLPEAAKGIGKSMRIFKAETKAMRDDGEEEEKPKSDEAVTKQPSQLPAAEQAQQPTQAHSSTEAPR